MKPFLRHIILFIAFLIPIYIMGICLWGVALPSFLQKNIKYRIAGAGHLWSRLEDVRATPPVDVLFIGSSHVYRGFDPRIFEKAGLSSFNLGSSAQTPLQTTVLLSRYLPQLKPKLIVCEVYPTTLFLDGVESALDLISNDKNDGKSVSMALAVNNIKVYNTLVYGFFRDKMGLNKAVKEPQIKGDDHYVGRGYVENKVSLPPQTPFETMAWGAEAARLADFDALLAQIKAQNIPYILVQAPVMAAYYQSHTDNTAFDALMAARGSYYNFNRTLPLADSLHFIDKDHLNQAGVEVFNAALLPIVQAHLRH